MYTQIIEKLKSHFSNCQINLPASKSKIMELMELFPDMNDEIVLFFETCDGFSVTDSAEGKVFSIENIFSSYPIISNPEEFPLIKSLCPIRTDGCGDYDCIFLSKKSWNGSVVFWDHDTYSTPSYVLGGTFYGYLDILSQYLTTCFSPDGTLLPEYNNLSELEIPDKELKEFPWPFDSSFLIRRDKKAGELLENREFRKLLQKQD